MSSTHRLIPPKLPTVLADHTHVELPGYDLLLFYTEGIWIVPARIDIAAFEEAASRVLQFYPHGAGQLRCANGCWSIELTNTPIPLDIDCKLDTNSDVYLNDNWVVQDDISQLLGHKAHLDHDSMPLLRLKLTFFKNETCIGGSWHHSLGDGAMMHRCFHTLSQFYQGLPAEFAAPTFRKYHLPKPSDSVVAELSQHMPYLQVDRHLDESEYAKSRKVLEHVMWRIDCRDVGELRAAVTLNLGQDGTFLSKQDCLAAYLIMVLNHARGNPIEKVTNTISCRYTGTPFFSDDLASNLLVDVTTEVPTDILGIAKALRNALMRCRDSNYIYDWMVLANSLMLEAANAGKVFPYSPDDNGLILNSFTALDWCSSHFGYPDGTRFHTNGVDKFNLRCFKSNPRKGDDGVWQASQSIDISMGTPAGLKEKILETLSEGIRHVIDN